VGAGAATGSATAGAFRAARCVFSAVISDETLFLRSVSWLIFAVSLAIAVAVFDTAGFLAGALAAAFTATFATAFSTVFGAAALVAFGEAVAAFGAAFFAIAIFRILHFFEMTKSFWPRRCSHEVLPIANHLLHWHFGAHTA
jgi:hypothetical protein